MSAGRVCPISGVCGLRAGAGGGLAHRLVIGGVWCRGPDGFCRGGTCRRPTGAGRRCTGGNAAGGRHPRRSSTNHLPASAAAVSHPRDEARGRLPSRAHRPVWSHTPRLARRVPSGSRHRVRRPESRTATIHVVDFSGHVELSVAALTYQEFKPSDGMAFCFGVSRYARESGCTCQSRWAIQVNGLIQTAKPWVRRLT